MNFRETAEAPGPGFPLAPMLDIVFLLLCFFITTQVFSQWESEIDITLPTAETGDAPDRLYGEIIMNVFPDGVVKINRRSYDPPALQDLLSKLVAVSPGYPVLIRADEATAYRHVIDVLDVCRKCDIWNISFATAKAQEKAP